MSESIEIKKLLDINKQAIYDKLDKVKKIIGGLWLCNNIIGAISEAKSRNKRIINNYDIDEVVTRSVNINGILRNCRCFTKKVLLDIYTMVEYIV